MKSIKVYNRVKIGLTTRKKNSMKNLISTTKTGSLKGLAGILMVASLALSPLSTQLSIAQGAQSNSSSNINYPIAEHLMQMVYELKLSSQETELIKKKLSLHKDDYEVITSKIKKTKNELLQLPANATEEQLKKLAQTQSDNIKSLIQLRVKVRQEIFSVLSDEQRKQLSTKLEKAKHSQVATSLGSPNKSVIKVSKNKQKEKLSP